MVQSSVLLSEKTRDIQRKDGDSQSTLLTQQEQRDVSQSRVLTVHEHGQRHLEKLEQGRRQSQIRRRHLERDRDIQSRDKDSWSEYGDSQSGDRNSQQLGQLDCQRRSETIIVRTEKINVGTETVRVGTETLGWRQSVQGQRHLDLEWR